MNVKEYVNPCSRGSPGVLTTICPRYVTVHRRNRVQRMDELMGYWQYRCNLYTTGGNGHLEVQYECKQQSGVTKKSKTKSRMSVMSLMHVNVCENEGYNISYDLLRNTEMDVFHPKLKLLMCLNIPSIYVGKIITKWYIIRLLATRRQKKSKIMWQTHRPDVRI